jgi:hypothetical protein
MVIRMGGGRSNSMSQKRMQQEVMRCKKMSPQIRQAFQFTMSYVTKACACGT